METNNGFGSNVSRGFAQGVGTILAYGIALLILSLLTKDEQPEDQVQTQSAGGSCSAWT